MRFSIQRRLFTAFLGLLVLSLAASTALSTYFGLLRMRAERTTALERIVDVVARSTFPITEPVVDQMRGLGGADFVLSNRHRGLAYSTIPLSSSAIAELRTLRPHDPAGATTEAFPAVELDGRPYRVAATRVDRDRSLSPHGTLYILLPEQDWWAASLETARPIGIGGLGILFLAALGSAVLAAGMVRPIRRLRDQAETIALGHFETVPLPRRNDEIRDLAVAVNRMASRLADHEEAIRRREQLGVVTRIGSGIAHQLRNAATGARMAIQLASSAATPPDVGESLQQALRQLERMESHIQRFVSLGARTGPAETVDLGAVVDEAVGMVEATCRHLGIDVHRDLADDAPKLRGDRGALLQMVMNLVLNAIDAVASREEADGPGVIRVALARDVATDAARFTVEDNGPGPPETMNDHIFDLFTTSKPEGTGLGLYIVRQVALQHNGGVAWDRAAGWTRFRVLLPIARPPSP